MGSLGVLYLDLKLCAIRITVTEYSNFIKYVFHSSLTTNTVTSD